MGILRSDFGRGALAAILGIIGIACFAILGNSDHTLTAYSLLLVGSLAIAISAILSLVIVDKYASRFEV